MAEHTKTPWRLGRNCGEDTVFSGNRVVAMCDTDVNAPQVDKANAAFIIRACNSHGDLMLALAWLHGLLTARPHDFDEQLPLAIGAAKAALEKGA
jgi:hypothetical protein